MNSPLQSIENRKHYCLFLDSYDKSSSTIWSRCCRCEGSTSEGGEKQVLTCGHNIHKHCFREIVGKAENCPAEGCDRALEINQVATQLLKLYYSVHRCDEVSIHDKTLETISKILIENAPLLLQKEPGGKYSSPDILKAFSLQMTQQQITNLLAQLFVDYRTLTDPQSAEERAEEIATLASWAAKKKLFDKRDPLFIDLLIDFNLAFRYYSTSISSSEGEKTAGLNLNKHYRSVWNNQIAYRSKITRRLIESGFSFNSDRVIHSLFKRRNETEVRALIRALYSRGVASDKIVHKGQSPHQLRKRGVMTKAVKICAIL